MLVYVRKYLKILLQVFYECGFGFGIQVAGQEKRFFVSGGKVFYSSSEAMRSSSVRDRWVQQ